MLQRWKLKSEVETIMSLRESWHVEMLKGWEWWTVEKLNVEHVGQLKYWNVEMLKS